MKWIQPFTYSAGGILLAAAVFRFWIAAGDAPALALPDAVLGLPLRAAVLLVGGFELAVALHCLFGRRAVTQTGWLAFLSTSYLVYVMSLYLMHWQPQGTCLGSLTDPLHLARGDTGFFLALAPWYLILGSYAAMFCTLRSGRAGWVRVLKISCAACAGHIEFPRDALGTKIPCPHCRADLTLQEPVLEGLTTPATRR